MPCARGPGVARGEGEVILTDGVHLVSDKSPQELRAFADSIGLKGCWYRRGHYDLWGNKLGLALRAGAEMTSRRECARMRRRMLGKIEWDVRPKGAK